LLNLLSLLSYLRVGHCQCTNVPYVSGSTVSLHYGCQPSRIFRDSPEFGCCVPCPKQLNSGQANVPNFHCAKSNVNKNPYFRFLAFDLCLTASDKLLPCPVTHPEEPTTFGKTKKSLPNISLRGELGLFYCGGTTSGLKSFRPS